MTPYFFLLVVLILILLIVILIVLLLIFIILIVLVIIILLLLLLLLLLCSNCFYTKSHKMKGYTKSYKLNRIKMKSGSGNLDCPLGGRSRNSRYSSVRGCGGVIGSGNLGSQ